MQGDPFAGLERLDIGDVDASAMVAPEPIQALIADADARIARFRGERETIVSFIVGNALFACQLIERIVASGLVPGRRFCEWGSGFGVVACIARQLGLQASGIEIEADLVEQSRRLAGDHGLAVDFLQGSYLPGGAFEERVDPARVAEPLGVAPTDFDLIYVYPWPAEHRVVGHVFRDFARPGTLLLAYHGGCRFDVFRKPPSGAQTC